MSEKAIVLLSGGLDSAVSLWWAMRKRWRCTALGFDYGQRHSRETEHAKRIARRAHVPYQIVRFDLPWSRSSLTDRHAALPHRAADKIPATIPSTYVPGRNTLFLSFAMSLADQINARKIVIGANAIDYSGYPDCRGPYLNAFETVARRGTRMGTELKRKIEIEAPLLKLTKADIVRLGFKIHAPLELTWSCYQGQHQTVRSVRLVRVASERFCRSGHGRSGVVMVESAFVSEIYASVQGEGPYSGERQIFVRLAGCPLRCRYCDTPGSLTAQGHGRFSVDDVITKIKKLQGRAIKTVSVTGGEPLAQPAFVAALFRELKKRGVKTYLETSGVHTAALRRVQRYTDVVSMDIKLPSAVGREYWAEHRAFLKVAGKKAFVKIVWEAASKLSELKKAVMIARGGKPIPLLILQPVSPVDKAVRAPAPRLPTADHLADAYAFASARLPRVLVMPQQHKLWNVR